ncbi:MAG: acylphosphatase [Nitrospinota bacterium]
MKRRLHLLVHGMVQGVGYRFAVQRQAERLGLSGWVRNCPDGTVELAAEGEEETLQLLLAWCRQGPRGARVRAVEPRWEEAKEEAGGFRIAF